MSKQYPIIIDVTDTGSSVYPEARPNPFSFDDPPLDNEQYIFASSTKEAFELFDKWLEKKRMQHE